MRFKRAKLALAAAFALAAWSNRDLINAPPLQARFNDEATALNKMPSYVMPSAVKPQASQQEIWAIRVGARPMAAGGHHLFLEFAPADIKAHPHKSDGHIFQIHGVAMDREAKGYIHFEFGKLKTWKDYFTHTEALKIVGVNANFDEGVVGHEPDRYVDVFYGTKDEVLRMYIDAMTLADELNARDLDYGLLTQNSNSVTGTLLKGLGLPAPDIYEDSIRANLRPAHIWTPALEQDLLPPDWTRQNMRDVHHHDGLSGAALEKAAKQSAHGEVGIWPAPKAAHQARRASGPAHISP